MSTSQSFTQRLGRFAGLNIGQHLWLAAVSLVATPILYHRLGEASYGLLSVVTLAAAQLSVLEFGVGHATIRSLGRDLGAEDYAGMSRTVATSIWVFLFTALVGFIVLFAGGGILAERYFQIPVELLGTGKLALRIGAAFFALMILGNLASSVWQGLQRFGFLNLVSGVAASGQLIGSVLLVLLGHGVLWVLAWSVVLGAASLATHVWWLRRSVPRLRPYGLPDGEAFREMIRFGSVLTLAGVFTQVFFSGGPLVLGHYVLVGALPFYTVPFGLYQRLNRIGFGLASALYPLVAELDGDNDTASLRRVFTSGTRILMMVGVAGAGSAVLLATPFLTLWMGPEFAAQGGMVLELFFVAFALSLTATPAMEVARGTGRAGLLVQASAILAAVNVLGVVLLAPRLGALGAGVSFLSAQLAGTCFIVARVGGRAWTDAFGNRTVAVALVTSLAAYWGLATTSDPAVRLLMAAVLGPAAVALGFAWALSDEERAALLRLAGRT